VEVLLQEPSFRTVSPEQLQDTKK